MHEEWHLLSLENQKLGTSSAVHAPTHASARLSLPRYILSKGSPCLELVFSSLISSGLILSVCWNCHQALVTEIVGDLQNGELTYQK